MMKISSHKKRRDQCELRADSDPLSRKMTINALQFNHPVKNTQHNQKPLCRFSKLLKVFKNKINSVMKIYTYII